MIPDSFRPVAKAIVGAIVPVAAILVAVGVLDVDVANKVTTELIALATALGLVTGGSVYATRSR